MEILCGGGGGGGGLGHKSLENSSQTPRFISRKPFLFSLNKDIIICLLDWDYMGIALIDYMKKKH